MQPSRRALLRGFLALPVAARFAPAVAPSAKARLLVWPTNTAYPGAGVDGEIVMLYAVGGSVAAKWALHPLPADSGQCRWYDASAAAWRLAHPWTNAGAGREAMLG